MHQVPQLETTKQNRYQQKRQTYRLVKNEQKKSSSTWGGQAAWNMRGKRTKKKQAKKRNNITHDSRTHQSIVSILGHMIPFCNPEENRKSCSYSTLYTKLTINSVNFTSHRDDAIEYSRTPLGLPVFQLTPGGTTPYDWPSQ